MIKDIDYLKPDADSQDVISEFIKKLVEGSKGKGCFTTTLYRGENSVIAKSIIIYFSPYDQTGKLYPLGGYMWLIKLEFTSVLKDSNPLTWYDLIHGGKVIYNVDVTFMEP